MRHSDLQVAYDPKTKTWGLCYKRYAPHDPYDFYMTGFATQAEAGDFHDEAYDDCD